MDQNRYFMSEEYNKVKVTEMESLYFPHPPLISEDYVSLILNKLDTSRTEN